MTTVLLVEDEMGLLTVLQETLELYNYQVITAVDGISAIRLYHTAKPHIAVIDIMLPRLDGYSVLKEIRRNDKDIPVILLTAKTQTTDLVKGFDYGADDYIKKPVVIDELLARIKVLINRAQKDLYTETKEEIFTFGIFEFNYNRQELRSQDETLQLSYKDSEILKKLLQRINSVTVRSQLLKELWGDDNFYTSRTLNVYITRLRHYLKKDTGIQILNIRGIGFKLVR